jgi:EAL domain-containing protein (putative c-di-GMP-specific phosphodiesterase class I)
VIAQDLDPRRMVLEITESAAMTNVGPVLENLARLRMKGFGLSIDDYGTGYSSMQQLTRIPFTELKIDRSFVAGASRHETSRVILESSLGMARKLNIQSVGEGAETREDWDLLLACGCDLVQGYFVAKPMEAAKFTDWMREWRAPAAA